MCVFVSMYVCGWDAVFMPLVVKYLVAHVWHLFVCVHLCDYACIAIIWYHNQWLSCLQVNWMVWLGLRVLLASCPIELRGMIVQVFSSMAHDSSIILSSL